MVCANNITKERFNYEFINHQSLSNEYIRLWNKKHKDIISLDEWNQRYHIIHKLGCITDLDEKYNNK